MLLAIDVGNTNAVFALYEGREQRTRWRIATDPRRTGDEYAVWLMQLLALEGFDKSAIHAIIIGTVVPRAIHNLTVLSQKYFGVEPMVAGEGRPHTASMLMSTNREASAPIARSTRSPRTTNMTAIWW